MSFATTKSYQEQQAGACSKELFPGLVVKSSWLILHAGPMLQKDVTRFVLVLLLQVIILLLTHVLTGAIQDAALPVTSKLLGFKMCKI